MIAKLGLLSNYKTLASLPPTDPTSSALSADRRSKFEICVIDDETFDFGKKLRSYGYRFAEIGDLKSVSEVNKYPIVLCDLMGVGLNFDHQKQGAMLIREIRKNYPTIMVAAYSGASRGSDLAQAAMFFADTFIQKDATYDDWTDELDSLIRQASDRRKAWSRIRLALVEDGIDTKTLLKLEDAYVRSILSGKTGGSELEAEVDSATLTKFSRDVLKGFITGLLVKLVVGP